MKSTYSSIRQVRMALLLGISISFAPLPGCKQPDEQVVVPQETPAASSVAAVEEAFPGRTGIIRQGKLFGMPISYEEIDGKAVFEGDIILSEEQLSENVAGTTNGRVSGAGRTGDSYRWLNNTVYYTIDPSLPNKSRVTDAIAHWQSTTNLHFISWTNQADYITFTSGPGSSSAIGRQGGQQFITLSGQSTTENMVHEIGHAIGLFHEHARADRDQHIVIHWDNIQLGKTGHFSKYTQMGAGVLGFDHGPFDFQSRMLFPYKAYAIDPTKATMSKVGGGIWANYSTGLSAGDIACVNDMYPGAMYKLPGKAREINVGPLGHAYILGTQAVTMPYFKGYELYKWTSSGWSKVSGIAGVDIEVSTNGRPWIVNAQNEIIYYTGEQWEKWPGAARKLGLGPNGDLYMISNTPMQGGYQIKRWNSLEKQWKNIGQMGGVAIDIDRHNVAWMITESHQIYRLTPQYEWELMPGLATDIGTGGNGSVYITGYNPDYPYGSYPVYKWTGSSWLKQTGYGKHISADGNDIPWVVADNGDIFRRGMLMTNRLPDGTSPIPVPVGDL